MTPEPAHQLTLEEHAAASEKRHAEILEDITECREKIDSVLESLESNGSTEPLPTPPELAVCLSKLESLESRQSEVLTELQQIRRQIQENRSASNPSTPPQSSEEPEPAVVIVEPPPNPNGENTPPADTGGAAPEEPARRWRPKKV